jgi:hypothetical protein
VPGWDDPFGTIGIAFSQYLDGGTGEALEGVPLHLDVPLARTFERQGRYDRMLVDAAIEAMQEFRP